MRVSDVMTRQVVTVRRDTTFKEAVELLLASDVSGLPVIDSLGRVIGIVTEGDLIIKEAFPDAKRRRLLGIIVDAFAERPDWSMKALATTVADVMSTDVEVATPGEDVRAAARRMLRAGVKRLPVVDDESRLVGIVSRHDLLSVFHRSDADLVRAVRLVLDRSLYLPPEHDVTVSASDGVVTLRGTVFRQSDIAIAPALVKAVDGVVDVVAELDYREKDVTYVVRGPVVYR